MPTDLAVADRRALSVAALAAARRDPVAWCELATRGRWMPADHAVLMLRWAQRIAETGGRGILSVSVRHSKTWTISQGFSGWWLGTHPHDRIIHGTAEADLAEANSGAIRDQLTEFGPVVFGVGVDQGTHAKRRWDIADHDGGVTAVGRGGAPEGRGGHLLIDDPYRNFEDAMSPATRRHVRDWWLSSLRPRMEPGAWAIVICSRWHTEDLTGWLLAEFGELWDELRLPAICDEPGDPLGRGIGQPLWPDRWPLEELEKARAETISDGGEVTWSARYQQKPMDLSSTMFPADCWDWVDSAADAGRVVTRARGWDLAATDGAGDWTVGVLVAKLADGRWMVEDVVRAQAGPDGVRALLKATAEADGRAVTQVVPQDPGQAGKDQGVQIVRLLAPNPVTVRPVTGSKEVRALGWSSQQRTGNVTIVRTPTSKLLVGVHSSFPGGQHDDDVDAATEAFNFLAAAPPQGSGVAAQMGGRIAL